MCMSILLRFVRTGRNESEMELVQKRMTIGQFHREFYVPMLNRSRYHMASYKLAAYCRSQRHDISRGSISSHRDYGERMGLLFNEEIQSGYYQNTSVSVEGASVEWVDEAWSDDSKQDASATTHNMRSELCIDGDATQLIDGLEKGGTVWKGTDAAAVSYRCSKSIYGQGVGLQSMPR
jgi:hypothetical protein